MKLTKFLHQRQNYWDFQRYSKKNEYLCTRKLTPSHFEMRWSGYREGALHFGNASLTLCFGDSKLPQTNGSRNNAEVDAAGRYIPSRWRAEGKLCPHARFWGVNIYQRRGYHSALFTTIGCGRPRIADRQKPETPLFLL
jgi:hypothetical protein